MSGPMMLANLAGRKRETRRITQIQPEPPFYIQPMHGRTPEGTPFGDWSLWRECGPDYDGDDLRCPYGKVGDRLRVKEGFRITSGKSTGPNCYLSGVYAADKTAFCLRVTERDFALWQSRAYPYRGTPGRFMYASLSRMTLEITAIRVERVQDLTEEAALAEGIVYDEKYQWYHVPGLEHPNNDFLVFSRPTAREMYAALFDTINGSGAWLGNPLVWVVEYKIVNPS